MAGTALNDLTRELKELLIRGGLPGTLLCLAWQRRR